jgi:hypothetical protein
MKDKCKKNVAKLVLLVFLWLLMAGCEGVSGSGDTSQSDTAGNTNQLKTPKLSPVTETTKKKQAEVHLDAVRIWLDFSGSNDNDLLAKYVEDLVGNFERNREKISGVEVVYFSHGDRLIVEEKAEKFVWGSPPPKREFEPDMEKAPSDAKMFKEARDKFIEAERSSFNEENEKAQAGYETRVEDELKKLKDYLLQRPDVSAPCTRFVPLATRMKAENLSYNLVITDGWADCRDEGEKTISAIEPEGKNVILQLTAKKDSEVSGNEIKKREHFLRELFPRADIFPIYMSNQAIETLFR